MYYQYDIMINHAKEDALSEVIGFILIIAVITIIASLYMVYVVPAQGREAEIEHMNYVKDQFVDFKIRMDSLWLNNEPNVTVSQNIEMGTLGKKTEGNLVVIPIMQPVGSDGEIAVIPDDSTDISFTMDAYLAPPTKTIPQSQYGGSGIYPTQFIDVAPTFSSSDFSSASYLPLGSISPVNISASGDPPWIIYLQVANTTHFYPESSVPVYDLEMSIIKSDNGVSRNLLLNTTIYHEISSGTSYTIDIYDPIYGLNENYAYTQIEKTGDLRNSITIPNPSPDFQTVITQNVTPVDIGYDKEYGFSTEPHPMGVFSYTGNNFYWIPQTYFYQMGGVFLSQSDGMTNKIVPLINLFVGPDNTAGIRISDIQINKDDRIFRIAGTSPVQVLSRVDGITKNKFPQAISEETYMLADSPNNAEYVQIAIETDKPELWRDTFRQILFAANVTDSATKFPADWVTITSDANHAYLMVNGRTSETAINDVTLEYVAVDTTIIIQPVGFSNN